MRYVFLDTNIYLTSAISSQSEHKIDSFNILKKHLSADNIKLLLPEIVRIEFERKHEELTRSIQDAIDKLESAIMKSKFGEFPILEGEKLEIKKTLDKLKKDKIKKSRDLIQEIKELFEFQNVVYIALSPDIFTKAFIRCLKRRKPFKRTDISKLNNEIESSASEAWLGDCIIAESLITFLRSEGNSINKLLFCSGNIDDFAAFDQDKKKHLLHKDIKDDISQEVTYYRYLPDMLKTEFKEAVSKANLAKNRTAADLLNDYLKREFNTKPFQDLANYVRNLNESYSSSVSSLLGSVNDFQKLYQKSLLGNVDDMQKLYKNLGVSPLEVYLKSIDKESPDTEKNENLDSVDAGDTDGKPDENTKPIDNITEDTEEGDDRKSEE